MGGDHGGRVLLHSARSAGWIGSLLPLVAFNGTVKRLQESMAPREMEAPMLIADAPLKGTAAGKQEEINGVD